jgi:hypothetical protein
VLQLATAQLPPAQDAIAFGCEQGLPQAPQSLSVVTLRSQPLSGLPSQLAKPVEQAGAQS